MRGETPLFFGNDGSRLFGVIHRPERLADERGIGVVMCAPFAEEKLWSHRVYVNCARLMSQKGFTVLRFDQRGHGDSDGNHEDATVESYLSDIKQAIYACRQRTDVKSIGLLGLRLGGTMAALAARDAGAEFLILWEPVITGRDYFQKCLRSNLASQLLLHHKVIKTREQLISDLLKGELINIDGYLISPQFYLQTAQIDLMKDPRADGLPILFIKINRNLSSKADLDSLKLFQIYDSANSCCVYKTVQEEPFWGELKTYFQRSSVLFAETLSWMDRLDQYAPTGEKVKRIEGVT